jgi:hypothetical protein
MGKPELCILGFRFCSLNARGVFRIAQRKQSRQGQPPKPSFVGSRVLPDNAVGTNNAVGHKLTRYGFAARQIDPIGKRVRLMCRLIPDRVIKNLQLLKKGRQYENSAI